MVLYRSTLFFSFAMFHYPVITSPQNRGVCRAHPPWASYVFGSNHLLLGFLWTEIRAPQGEAGGDAPGGEGEVALRGVHGVQARQELLLSAFDIVLFCSAPVGSGRLALGGLLLARLTTLRRAWLT